MYHFESLRFHLLPPVDHGAPTSNSASQRQSSAHQHVSQQEYDQESAFRVGYHPPPTSGASWETVVEPVPSSHSQVTTSSGEHRVGHHPPPPPGASWESFRGTAPSSRSQVTSSGELRVGHHPPPSSGARSWQTFEEAKPSSHSQVTSSGQRTVSTSYQSNSNASFGQSIGQVHQRDRRSVASHQSRPVSVDPAYGMEPIALPTQAIPQVPYTSSEASDGMRPTRPVSQRMPHPDVPRRIVATVPGETQQLHRLPNPHPQFGYTVIREQTPTSAPLRDRYQALPEPGSPAPTPNTPHNGPMPGPLPNVPLPHHLPNDAQAANHAPLPFAPLPDIRSERHHANRHAQQSDPTQSAPITGRDQRFEPQPPTVVTLNSNGGYTLRKEMPSSGSKHKQTPRPQPAPQQTSSSGPKSLPKRDIPKQEPSNPSSSNVSVPQHPQSHRVNPHPEQQRPRMNVGHHHGAGRLDGEVDLGRPSDDFDAGPDTERKESSSRPRPKASKHSTKK